MSRTLFAISNVENNSEWIIKEFFNSVYDQGEFISVVNVISARRSCVINEDYCLFPELDSPDFELHFDGVKFGIMSDQIVITDDVFREFLCEACHRYIRFHPEDRDALSIMQLPHPTSK